MAAERPSTEAQLPLRLQLLGQMIGQPSSSPLLQSHRALWHLVHISAAPKRKCCVPEWSQQMLS